MKEVVFDPNTRKTIQNFPKEAKMELGKMLMALQTGGSLELPQSRPMPTIAVGAEELRVQDANGNYRVFYFKRFASKLLVFHAFKKKTQRTPRRELDTGRRRLQKLLEEEG